jgi:Domain of unknown function (DUF5666)
MRKSLIAATLLAITVFATGYIVGQVIGVTPSSAAGSTSTQTQTGAGSFRGFAPLGQHADGTVTVVNGDTITIKAGADRAGSNEYTAVTTVTLTGNTQYNAGPNATATKSSIKVGSYIIAEGTLSSDGKTLTATAVSLSSGGCPQGGQGSPNA